jgi:probable HAF family extracellular repeat protein
LIMTTVWRGVVFHCSGWVGGTIAMEAEKPKAGTAIAGKSRRLTQPALSGWAVPIAVLLCAAPPARAGTILWNTSTSTPVTLGLDYVSAINNSGTAVGAVGNQAAEVSASAPGATVVLSGIPLNSPSSFASGINNLGEIAGSFEDPGGAEHAFVWSSATGLQLLGNLGGNLSTAFAINDDGQVVGQSATTNSMQAFMWSSGAGMVAVGDSGTYLATGVNNSGEIACQEDPSPYTQIQAALCGPSPGSVTALSIFSADPWSAVSALNNQGWFVGTAQTPSGIDEGFLRTPQGMTIFGATFLPVSLNDSGQVIGSYNGQPAVWTSAGGFLVLPNSFGDILTGINDNGQIVGDSSASPEPGTFQLAFGILVLALIPGRLAKNHDVNAPVMGASRG